MRHPIQKQIAAIRRRVYALLGIYSLSRVLAAVIVTLGVLGLCDYLIHIQDRGLRIICSLTVVGVFVWALVRYVGSALAGRFRELDIAQRIERRFPQLNDRLASTVQFLRESEDNPLAGSSALRRAVITQTTAEVEKLRLRDCIDPRVVWRAAALAGVLSVLAANRDGPARRPAGRYGLAAAKSPGVPRPDRADRPGADV
jgi:type III secretory pathway component EscS